MIWATRYTGNKLFFKGGLGAFEIKGGKVFPTFLLFLLFDLSGVATLIFFFFFLIDHKRFRETPGLPAL